MPESGLRGDWASGRADADAARPLRLLQWRRRPAYRLLGVRPRGAGAMTLLARVDGSQRPMAKALRELGLPIVYLHQLGGGVPDMLTRHVDGHLVLIEAKTPGKRTKKETREKQEAFARLWPVHRCETVEDALRAVGALK